MKPFKPKTKVEVPSLQALGLRPMEKGCKVEEGEREEI